jgi:putative tryptophan/tyrosine transport system substrate-binding protein
MDRRAFLSVVTGSVLARPLIVEPQSGPAKPMRVGWLATVPLPELQAEFRRGMRDLEHIEGSTYVLDERYANAADQLSGAAAELIRLNDAVIVAQSAVAVRAAKQATTAIPIVFITGDPVEFGFAYSLARPGGNLTGVANLTFELYPKRIELLKAALPRMRRLATLQTSTLVDPARTSRIVQSAARANGIEALPVSFVSSGAELDNVFAQASRAHADAMLVAPSPFFNTHRDRVLALAARYRLPALYEFRDFVEAGGLMCYGADMKAVYRQLASYVDRVLKGAKPADLPVEQPTKFELIINMKTAKALGLTIPQTLLLRADQVIE